MSQHEIEDLVERSIRVLHTHDTEPDHRSAFAALWAFQERADCGFTHFRVMPILLEHRSTYRFDKTLHPAIETLEADGVSRQLGYVDDDFLYCDAGTQLWEQLRTYLPVDDRKPPEPMPLSTLALRICRAAETAGETELIAMWFNFGPRTLLGSHFTKPARAGEKIAVDPETGDDVLASEDCVVERVFTAEEAAALPEALELRELVRRTRAMEVELAYDVRPPPEWRGPLLAWWWS